MDDKKSQGGPRLQDLPAAALAQVAEYFQALAEPTRLRAISLLRLGEQRVGEIAEHCGCTQANMSRHLALLGKQGIVLRVSRGTSAYYSIADPGIHVLCEVVCASIGCRVERTAADRDAFIRPCSEPSQTEAVRMTQRP